MKNLLLLALAASSHGQSTISPTDRYAYAANAGWIDFRVSAPDGVRVSDTCLAGFAYGANFGFMDLGNGAPLNGHSYSNASATNFGVNVSPAGLLTGYAYAANIGWVQFEQTHGQPKIDLLTGKYSGHAYSANLGWIALDTPSSDLATTTIFRPDTDTDGIPDYWENLQFGNLTLANASTDRDGDGASDAAEYMAATLPTDAASLLRITAHSYNSNQTIANLTWTISPVRNYRLEYDTDLAAPWTNSALGTITPAPGTTATRSLTLATAPKRFFRAVAVLPLP